jgi:hypothetical protein
MYEIVLIIIHIIIRLCSRVVRSSHITRAVLGPAKHEDVPLYHGPCLGLVKNLSCHAGTARCWGIQENPSPSKR